MYANRDMTYLVLHYTFTYNYYYIFPFYRNHNIGLFFRLPNKLIRPIHMQTLYTMEFEATIKTAITHNGSFHSPHKRLVCFHVGNCDSPWKIIWHWIIGKRWTGDVKQLQLQRLTQLSVTLHRSCTNPPWLWRHCTHPGYYWKLPGRWRMVKF